MVNDLAGFALRMQRLADNIGKNTDALMIRTALAIDQALVLSTPVKEGRARGNWFVGLGHSVDEATEETDKAGRETIARNSAKIQARRRGQDIFLTNNVPYIIPLNQGSSAQAPAMFVEQAVRLGSRIAGQARLLKD